MTCVIMICVNLQVGDFQECVHHSQLLIIKDVEQLLHQSITGQRLIIDDATEVPLALQQFLPWSIQEGIT